MRFLAVYWRRDRPVFSGIDKLVYWILFEEIKTMSSMYDHNDAELVEGMKYLVLPAEEKIKLQAQPFDGKKACWVPDPKESYVAGEITGTKGDDVTVKTGKGEVRRSMTTIWSSLSHVRARSLDSDGEEGQRSTDESSEIFVHWWYGWSNLFERRFGLGQSPRSICTLADLCMFSFALHSLVNLLFDAP